MPHGRFSFAVAELVVSQLLRQPKAGVVSAVSRDLIERHSDQPHLIDPRII
jgi:hypothetical protein